MQLHFKFDLNSVTDFLVCATDPGEPSGLACFGAGSGFTQIDWSYFERRLDFPNAAGSAPVYVLIRFRDRDPDATSPHHGVNVDRVVIRGISHGR
ncbi:MAG: hypothetical protein IPG72_16195 [Ardenticatenales bacterium]|nr:hypothetical protein [Ardenticatenales bacterium]